MPVYWKPPALKGAPSFAYWGEAVFGYVTQTAHRDGRWLIKVYPRGQDDGKAMKAYAKTEAQAKKFVERWAEHNHQRIAPPKGRQIMPHEGGK